MNKIRLLLPVMVCVTQLHALATPQEWRDKREIWFSKPATKWKLGLPVGNGRLGAMVAGTYPKERIQLNEDSIWAKEPLLRHSETTKDKIDEVQRLVDAGKYKAAHDFYQSNIPDKAAEIGSYQTMGDLWIEHVGPAKSASAGYRRSLDVATGLVSVNQPLSDGSVLT